MLLSFVFFLQQSSYLTYLVGSSNFFSTLLVSTGLAPPKGSGLLPALLTGAAAGASAVRGFKLRRGRSEGRSERSKRKKGEY